MHDVEPGRAGSSRSRPAPKDYKPLTLPDGRLATLGIGAGSPAARITARHKGLKPTGALYPGPGAYEPHNPNQAATSFCHPTASGSQGLPKVGGYSPRSGAMSGQHASKKALAPSSSEAPGPGTYSPTILRNGRDFAPGADAPAWKLLGRSPAARFISKAHSDIDNAGRNGPGPAGYSPRQTTARGERELLVRLTLEDEEVEYDDDDDGGGDEAAAGAEVKTAVAP